MKLLIVLVLFCSAMAQNKRATKGKPVGPAGPIDDQGQNSNVGAPGGPRSPPAAIWHDFNAGSYRFFSTPTTWTNAQAHCLTMGAHLTVLDSQAEEDFVRELAGGEEIWIGLSDAQRNGYWFWINSAILGYTNWCENEPNNRGGNQKCAAAYYSELKCWDDQECHRRHPYVCEKSKCE